MFTREKLEDERIWISWGIQDSSNLEKSLHDPDENFRSERGPAKTNSADWVCWNKGTEYGKQFAPLLEVLDGKIGSASFPKEFRDYLLDNLEQFKHLTSSITIEPVLVRTRSGSFEGNEKHSLDAPIGIVFGKEKTKWNPNKLKDTLRSFIKDKTNVLLEELCNSQPRKPVEKDISMAHSSNSVGAPKSLTLSPVNARVLRIQSIKFIKSATKKLVEEKLPEDQRVGVMKLLGEVLDRDIPDAVILSAVAWLTDIAGPAIIPNRLQSVSATLVDEFKQEGEALIKSSGVDLVKELAGPLLLSFYSMAEKYFEEAPVEVGPGHQIEEGLDIKKMADEMKEKVPARKSTAQKVA